MKPLNNKYRLSDQIAEQILQLIKNQKIKAGDKLPAERVLSETLGVSRPPIREAIRTLASQGLLMTRRGDGTYVQSDIINWSDKNIMPLAQLLSYDSNYNIDMLEARIALESSTAFYAAQRATKHDKENIKRCFDAMVKYQDSKDSELASRADAQFHLSIAEASQNVALIQLMRSIFDVLFSVVNYSRNTIFNSAQPCTIEKLTKQHKSLMQAILNNDPDMARQNMELHLDYVKTSIQDMTENTSRRDRASKIYTGKFIS